MNSNSEEFLITNLGNVPKGVSYADAVKAVKHLRRYHINPYNGGHRLTLCDTLRMSWRLLDEMSENSQKQQLYEYLAQSFHYAKAMDSRMKYLKQLLDENNIEYEKGGKPST